MHHAGDFASFQVTKINSSLVRIGNQVFQVEGGSVSDAEIETGIIFFAICHPLMSHQVGNH
jgi:hypothetical protein